MIDVEIDGSGPEHVERIPVQMSVDNTGKINWTPGFIDYNVNNYYRGKQITNDEFNTELLKQIYQGNYLTDSLNELLDRHLGSSIHNSFVNQFNLQPSYVKEFSSTDWGTLQSDGYYYITIPVSEHGFEPTEGVTNIDTEMFILNSAGMYQEVQQATISTDNTVTVYSDDNTLSGIIVVRTNEKAYRLANTTIVPAENIEGLATVAYTGLASALVDYTKTDGTGFNDRINKNTSDITKILSGVTVVPKASESDVADRMLSTGYIQGFLISNIFESESTYVKNSTHAINADRATADADNADIVATYAKQNGSYANMTVGNATKAAEVNGVISSNTTATTQSTSDNSTKVATTAFAQNLINTVRTQMHQVGTGKNSAGSLKLDNGIILKWGYMATPSGQNRNDVIFDNTYPFTQVYTISATPVNASDRDRWIQIVSYTTTQFTYAVYDDRTDCMYFAIGI